MGVCVPKPFEMYGNLRSIAVMAFSHPPAVKNAQNDLSMTVLP
jgi:hypothetical protein